MRISISLSLSLAALVAADASSYRANAHCNVDQLMRWYTAETGMWNGYWWQGASMLTSFNDIAWLDDNIKEIYGHIWDTTYHNAPNHRPYYWRLKRDNTDHSSFATSYFDDDGWWGLAWIGAWDNTHRDEYLTEAKLLYQDMRQGLDVPKCGGIPWKKQTDGTFTGPLAISNSLYIFLAASLANRVPDGEKAEYLDAAISGWNWYENVGFINADSLVNDGPGDDCKGDPQSGIYTYNQGTIIGALAELGVAAGNEHYFDIAEMLANAAIADGSPFLDGKGILADGCDKDQSCTGGDGSAFKGILIRNLRRVNNVRPIDKWKQFMEKNAQSIWNNDLSITNGGCHNGLYWSGPYAAVDEPIAQAVALDALTAALAATL